MQYRGTEAVRGGRGESRVVSVRGSKRDEEGRTPMLFPARKGDERILRKMHALRARQARRSVRQPGYVGQATGPSQDTMSDFSGPLSHFKKNPIPRTYLGICVEEPNHNITEIVYYLRERGKRKI